MPCFKECTETCFEITKMLANCWQKSRPNITQILAQHHSNVGSMSAQGQPNVRDGKTDVGAMSLGPTLKRRSAQHWPDLLMLAGTRQMKKRRHCFDLVCGGRQIAEYCDIMSYDTNNVCQFLKHLVSFQHEKHTQTCSKYCSLFMFHELESIF